MKHALRLTVLAGTLAGSFALSQVALGASGLPVESGGSETTGAGSHGTGAADTQDTTHGTKERHNQPGKQKPQMGNGPADKQGAGRPAEPDTDDSDDDSDDSD